MPAGEALRRARLRCGWSAEDIARALNIRVRQVEALEQGDIAALPAPVYAVGFMRAYAEYVGPHVGLDAERVVALFKAQARGAAEPQRGLNFPVPAGDSAAPPWWAVVLGLAAAGLLLWGWVAWQGGPEGAAALAVVPTPPPAAAEASAAPDATPAPVEPSVAAEEVAAAAGPPAPAAPPVEAAPAPEPEPAILLVLTADSWVEVRDASGTALVARVLKAGERYTVPSRADLVMTVGNAGGVALSVGGQALDPLGAPGEIVRGVPLDAAALLERYRPL
jgi:cytoskeleton protein RodZ